jgi:hypothetical protein
MPSTGFSRAAHTEFYGSNGAGACILPSVVGDTVVGVINMATRNSEAASFETISKAGHGENAATADLNKAQADQYQSTLDLMGGSATQTASLYSAAGTLAGGGASAYKMYSDLAPKTS